MRLSSEVNDQIHLNCQYKAEAAEIIVKNDAGKRVWQWDSKKQTDISVLRANKVFKYGNRPCMNCNYNMCMSPGLVLINIFEIILTSSQASPLFTWVASCPGMSLIHCSYSVRPQMWPFAAARVREEYQGTSTTKLNYSLEFYSVCFSEHSNFSVVIIFYYPWLCLIVSKQCKAIIQILYILPYRAVAIKILLHI